MSEEEQRLARACVDMGGDIWEEEEARQAVERLKRQGVEDAGMLDLSLLDENSQEGFVVWFKDEKYHTYLKTDERLLLVNLLT